MSDEIIRPKLSADQGYLAFSYLKGALPQLIEWMREDGTSDEQIWATRLDATLAAAERYAREGR